MINMIDMLCKVFEVCLLLFGIFFVVSTTFSMIVDFVTSGKRKKEQRERAEKFAEAFVKSLEEVTQEAIEEAKKKMRTKKLQENIQEKQQKAKKIKKLCFF